MTRRRRAHAAVWRWTGTAACAVVLVMGAPRPAQAHELGETAVTLVVREGGAVELRLLCTWSRILAPDTPSDTPSDTPASSGARERLMRLAAEPAPTFAARIVRLQRTLEAAVVARAGTASPQRFIAWQWPAPAAIQEALRQELMAAVTGNGADHHASRLMATARLVLGPAVPTLQVLLPPQLGPVLFTTLRPEEQWLAPSQPSPVVPLRRR